MDHRPDFQDKVIDMSAFGWITTGHRMPLASFLRRRRSRKAAARVSIPRIESLESIDLMSRAVIPAAPTAQVEPFVTSSPMGSVTALQTSQTTQVQTATVPNTLTNFSQAFAPPINLFNPALGTLLSVQVTATASLMSQISSANTSTTSGSQITGFTNGAYQITGLSGTTIANNLNATTGLPVTVPVFSGTTAFTNVPVPVTTPNFSVPTNGITFGSLVASDTQTVNFTQPADLAFFTASAGHTSISPVLTENAASGATAPNGNLQTAVATSGSGTITVTYVYMSACPPVTKLVRFGIHHQPTQLQLTFGGPLSDAVDAMNPAFYTVIVPNAHGSFTGHGVTTIPVTSAVYDPNNFTVTLTTAKRLNVHHLYQLQISLPCTNGTPVVIEFGGKLSLGGFTNHKGQFVPVVGGRVIHPPH
jgi:hypothetical protein